MTLNIKIDADELALFLRGFKLFLHMVVALTTLLLGARVLGPAVPHADGPPATFPARVSTLEPSGLSDAPSIPRHTANDP
jgi:hypothetical protein